MVFIHIGDFSNPSGILFLFHGCSHDGEHWFDLPEEVSIIKEAISRNLIPVAFSSQNRNQESKCWDISYPRNFPDNGASNVDLFKIGNAVKELITRYNWENLSFYALGVSSGGSFIPMLPIQLESDGIVFDSLAIYISPGSLEVII